MLKILSSRFPPRQRDRLQCFRQRQKEQKTVIESPLSVSKIESWTLKLKKKEDGERQKVSLRRIKMEKGRDKMETDIVHE